MISLWCCHDVFSCFVSGDTDGWYDVANSLLTQPYSSTYNETGSTLAADEIRLHATSQQ